MEKKLFFLFGLVVLVFAFLVFAQPISLYTKSDSISCGNNVCEETIVQLKVGEEKAILLGDKTHRFKVTRIQKTPHVNKIIQPDGTEKEETSYSYEVFLSVDGSPEKQDYQFRETLGSSFYASAAYSQPPLEISPGQQPPDPDIVQLRFEEGNFCAAPDCAYNIEFSVYKNWNLVPTYMIGGLQPENIEKSLGKGTCKLQNFSVIYSYDPVKKNYTKLYSLGKSFNDLSNSLSQISRQSNDSKVWFGSPFNAVWVHSDAECRLVGGIPKPFADNLLLIISAIVAEAEKEVPVAYQPGQEPPPPRKGTAPSFASGWNFFSGSNDFAAKGFDGIKGSCGIEKAYAFDAQSQSWNKIEKPPAIGTAFVFKVQNPCMFGFPETKPPVLPA